MSTSHRRKKKKTSRASPWNRSNPKSAQRSKRLTPAQKATAKRRAKKAGRPYPNLVDNMHVASKSSKSKSKAKSQSKARS